MNARTVAALLVLAASMVLAGLLVACGPDMVQPLPTVTPTTYGPPR